MTTVIATLDVVNDNPEQPQGIVTSVRALDRATFTRRSTNGSNGVEEAAYPLANVNQLYIAPREWVYTMESGAHTAGMSYGPPGDHSGTSPAVFGEFGGLVLNNPSGMPDDIHAMLCYQPAGANYDTEVSFQVDPRHMAKHGTTILNGGKFTTENNGPREIRAGQRVFVPPPPMGGAGVAKHLAMQKKRRGHVSSSVRGMSLPLDATSEQNLHDSITEYMNTMSKETLLDISVLKNRGDREINYCRWMVAIRVKAAAANLYLMHKHAGSLGTKTASDYGLMSNKADSATIHVDLHDAVQGLVLGLYPTAMGIKTDDESYPISETMNLACQGYLDPLRLITSHVRAVALQTSQPGTNLHVKSF